jgi:DNA polymerase
MIRLLRDYETRCDVSVVDVGPRRYAADPSLELLCVGFCVRTDAGWGPPLVAIGCPGSDGRAAIERRVRDAGFQCVTLDDFRNAYAGASVVVAHNEGFERAIEDRLFPELTAINKIHTCTASRARRLSLPGSLEDGCRVLRTPHQKSVEGHGVMLQCSQPRPTWRSRGQGPKWFDDADRLARTAIYCAQDVLAECDLDDFLPELPPQERIYWEHVEMINRRGMRLDVPLILAMERAVEIDQATAVDLARRWTQDPEFELTNPGKIRDFCARCGVFLGDLKASTVAQTLADHKSGAKPIHPAVEAVLEARKSVGGKTSIAKIPRMRARLMDDEHIRDSVIYHGAHTGRNTGDGINTLNLPRPYDKFDQQKVVEFLLTGNYEGIRVDQKVSPSTAVAAALRGVIIPSVGKKLVVGDYSSVEPCFAFTFAEQWDAVEVLRRRESLYVEIAQEIYKKKVSKEDKIEYQVGKILILMCQYGAGVDKFNFFLEQAGIHLPREDVERAHATYRGRFYQIPNSWKGLETAAKAALSNSGAEYGYHGVNFKSDGWWLVMRLPSGRPMYYPNARLLDGKYGKEIVYEGWMRIDGRPAGWGDNRTWGGSLLENLTQAACRDIMEEDQQEVETILGWEMKLTVYDELVAEAPIDDPYAVQRMTQIMSQPVPWLPMMPVGADVHETLRYAKH